MQKFLINCRWYRKLIHKRYGIDDVHSLHIPSGILGNFQICYLSYDRQGRVQQGFTNLKDALKNRGNLGLTVLY